MICLHKIVEKFISGVYIGIVDKSIHHIWIGVDESTFSGDDGFIKNKS
jgi:hypothetical protein